MRYFLFFLIWLSPVFLVAQSKYADQIKVVDRCTHLAEPVTVKALEINGADYNVMEAPKAIRACEKSRKEHPDDPHVMFLLARAYSKAERYEEGFTLARNACDKGDIGGCTLLGGYYDKGLYKGQYNPKKAYLLWLWTCNEGDPLACTNIAMLIENKRRYIPGDSKSKEDYLMEACIGGMYPYACRVVGNHTYFGTTVSENDREEYVNYRACAAGSDDACVLLKMHLEKSNDPLKEEKIFSSAKESCNNGNAHGCQDVGSYYGRKKRDKVNNLMAATFYEQGCSGGATNISCWYAGLYKIAVMEGLEQNIDLGVRYLEKSCYIGMNAFACKDLGIFYARTAEEAYRDPQKAIRPFERGCKLGNYYAEYEGCDLGIEICCEKKKKNEERHKSK